MAVLRRDLTTQTPWPDGTPGKDMRIQRGWRQTGPSVRQNLAMSYSLTHRQCLSLTAISVGNGTYGSYSNRTPVDAYNDWLNEKLLGKTVPLRNKAVSRFQAALGESASLGATLAEVPDSFRMIAERAASIVGAYRHLRRGRFKLALRQLNVRPKPEHKRSAFTRPKDASALWLEYWFGWAPLLGDIYSACNVVCGELPKAVVKGTASAPVVKSYYFGRWGGGYREELYGKVYAKAQAEVRVVNPNLYLLQKLGLLNPASVAWELVPFSFLADWFGNIGDVINDWTAYAGLELTNAFTTTTLKGVIHRDESYYHWSGPIKYRSTHKYIRVERVLGAPKHRLHFEIPGSLSATRAATAISLANLIFAKG